jgi:hypothetical protein
MLTMDDRIAAAIVAEGAALARTFKAHHRCMYKAGGPTLADAAEREDAEAALAVAKAHFAELLEQAPDK